MPRKGTTCLFKICFPTPVEPRAPEAVRTDSMKDNKQYFDFPEEGLPRPAPVPQQNAEEESHKDYYQVGLSSLEDQIALLDQKVAGVIENPDIRPSSARKMARKLGKGQKFLKSVKEGVASCEGIDADQEGEGLARAGSPEDFQDAAQEWTGEQGFEAAAEEAEAGAQDSDPTAEEAEPGAQELEAAQAGLDL